MILWLTGLPCSGKTTIGSALVTLLKESGHKSELLDGDVVRRELWPELGFSRADRDENVRRLGMIAGTVSRQGIAVVSAVSPYRSSRELVRRNCAEPFIEVYVNAPLAVCERRDVKGMYAKARAGEIPIFTGVSDPYEPPMNPDVECRTDLESVDYAVTRIMREIEERLRTPIPARTYFTGAGDGV